MSEPEAPGVKAGKQFLEANFGGFSLIEFPVLEWSPAVQIALHNSLLDPECCNQSADCSRRQCPRARA